MKLDRNLPAKRGKYALIKLRISNITPKDVRQYEPDEFVSIIAESIDFGDTEDSDFFVIRLKDKYAATALAAYAVAARLDGEIEYANEVLALSNAAAIHPNKKQPD